jgi:hypothetical protein
MRVMAPNMFYIAPILQAMSLAPDTGCGDDNLVLPSAVKVQKRHTWLERR